MEIVLFKVLISALRCHCLLLEDPVLSEGVIPLWKLLAPVREPLRLCWDLPSPPLRFVAGGGSGAARLPQPWMQESAPLSTSSEHPWAAWPFCNRRNFTFFFFPQKAFIFQSQPWGHILLYTHCCDYMDFLLLFGQILCFLFLWGHFIFRISIILLNCVALKMFTLCILHPMLQPVAKAHISKHIAIDFSLSPFFCVHKKLEYLFGICPLQ